MSCLVLATSWGSRRLQHTSDTSSAVAVVHYVQTLQLLYCTQTTALTDGLQLIDNPRVVWF